MLTAIVDAVLVIEAVWPPAPRTTHGPLPRSIDVYFCCPSASIVDCIDADPLAVNASRSQILVTMLPQLAAGDVIRHDHQEYEKTWDTTGGICQKTLLDKLANRLKSVTWQSN